MAPLSDPNQGRARAVLGGGITLLILPPLFVVLRVWARRLKRTPLCFNDYAIFIALIFTLGYNVSSVIGSIKGGLAQHMNTLSLKELTVLGKLTVAATLLWPTANTFVKFSVLHLYTRIFLDQRMTYATYAIGAVTVAYWLSTLVTALLICRPFAYNWDKITTSGQCGDVSAYYLSTGIVNLIIDVAIVALPLPKLWGLQMKTSKKLALTAIFSLGALICIISIIRVIAIQRLNYQDLTYSLVLDDICTSLEPTLGVINACLPILQPAISKLSSSTIFAWSKNHKPGGGSSGGRLWSKRSHEPSDDSKSGRFRHLLGDLDPLTGVTATESRISGPGRRGASDKDTDSMNDELEPHSGIKVKQHVGVYSTVVPGS